MTPGVTVVGSGASGVHFALTVLQRGGTVRMIDVGREGGLPVLPDATFGPGIGWIETIDHQQAPIHVIGVIDRRDNFAGDLTDEHEFLWR